jgi:hypothetical protein
MWYSFGDCSGLSGLRRTIACLLSRSLHTPDRRPLRRVRPPFTSIHPTPVPANRQQNERAAGTNQIIGPSPVRVNPRACNCSASQNTERLSGSLRFFRLQFAGKGNLAGKVPSRFGDWIAPQIKTTCWRRFRECRWCAPDLRRSCTRSTVQPISPEFDFPHRKIFRRPVTGHQSRRAASSEAALPVTNFPAQRITGKS